MRKQGFYRSHPEQEVAVRRPRKPTRISATFAWAGCSSSRHHRRGLSRCGWTKTPLDALNAAVRRGSLLLETAK
jgi:hypothetical protein